MDRREFVLRMATGSALVACGAISTFGCSESAPSAGSGSCGGPYGPPCPTNPPTAGDGDCTNDADVVYVRQTHTHTAMQLTGAQIAAAAPGLYELLTGNNHTHFIELTAQDFLDLEAGNTLMITSELTQSHRHDVEITC